MIAKAFRPVGWVAAITVAALVCYLLSLQVAAERSELASIEREIVATQQNIRALQTELGTRGRLSQLEQWNAEVLALSAPSADQFLESELRLARFDMREPPAIDGAPVRMASAEAPAAGAPGAPEAAPARAVVREAVARVAEPDAPAEPQVRRASLVVGVEAEGQGLAAVPPAAVQARAPSLLDESTLRDLRAAARAEREGSGGD